MTKPSVPDEWPYSCTVCGGGDVGTWCLPAAEMLATTDPYARGRLLARAFLHSLGRDAEGDPERSPT